MMKRIRNRDPWRRRALVLLALLVPSTGLRLSSSSTTAAFVGTPCKRQHRCSASIRYASQVEEEILRSEAEEETLRHAETDGLGASDTSLMYTSDTSSVKIVGMNEELIHDPNPRNGHSNGQPVVFHETPADVNGVPLDGKSQPTTVRKLWQRRHARSIDEGVRREKTREKANQLSTLLSKAPLGPPKKRLFARTISGLINALAEEVDGLEVNVDARESTPLWRKQFDAVRINFSRLGFKPLRMGGLDEAIRSIETQISESRVEKLAEDLELSAVSSVDEAFDRIDEDKSGALDPEEIAKALNTAALSDLEDEKLLEDLASQLVELYDLNGDGVVDRDEYQRLVADMATLRQAEKDRQEKENQEERPGFFRRVAHWLWRKEDEAMEEAEAGAVVEETLINDDARPRVAIETADDALVTVNEDLVNIDDDAAVDSVAGGSIVLEGLKLDLRQLIFGVVPLVKRVTPGGPLILEPFTATVTASFNKDDIRASMLLDAGLRRLVARALRRRVRSFRDLEDGAVFYGRRWNMASKSAPVVEVPELTSVEFDKENRIIMTGRAQVRTRPDAPVIENAFKVRTKIGTRNNGQSIRLVEPELAFVLECPKRWERNIKLLYTTLGLPAPERPKPLYSFFPIYSPFTLDDNDGFDLGEDNRIKSIEIKDGALQFELSAVLRPGRFLGNHYLAFTVPQRTFIITMDRVREGIRAARRNKRAAQAAAKQQANTNRLSKGRNYLDVVAQSLSSQELVEDRSKFRVADTRPNKKMVALSQPPNKSFFSRFVDGYLGARKDESAHHQRLTNAISDWFGRQGANDTSTTESDSTNSKQTVTQ